jgi:hypothetical protein
LPHRKKPSDGGQQCDGRHHVGGGIN